MNRVTIIGRSGANAELQYTQKQTPVVKLSIATSRNIGTYEAPEWQTTWHPITVWGKLAERIAPLVKKGSKVFVEGELQVHSWEKEGVKRQAHEIMARTVEVIEKIEQHQSGDMNENDVPF